MVGPDPSGPTTSVTPNDLFDLTGRVALVTGGGTHLGRAMATALAGAGAVVHLASRRRELCERVAAELSAGGATAFGHGCDITDTDAVRRLIDDIAARHGRFDVAVCNSGGSSARGPFLDMSPETLRATMDLNVIGTAVCAQAAARQMIPAGSGSIVLIGSMSGVVGRDRRAYVPDWPGSSADYYIAKGAVVNMARVLAMEWSLFGVRVNCLSPGQIPGSAVTPAQQQRWAESTPVGHVGAPRDLMGAVLLLASDAGEFITGQNILVDGGWTAR